MSGKSALVLGAGSSGRGRVRRAAILLGLGAIGCVMFAILFRQLTRLDPPAIQPEIRAAAELPVEVRGPRSYIGASWTSRERGLWEEHLEGGPYALGFA